MFTVATLNLHGRRHRWLQRRHLVLNELLLARPDLLALQEVSLTIGQARWLVRQLNARLGEEAYRLIRQRRGHLLWRFFEGVAVLSRLPVMAHDAISLGFGGRIALRVTIELASGDSVDFVTTHLHPPAYQPEIREEQVLRLQGWLNQRGSAIYQVVAGDFNEIPSGLAIQQMRQAYRSAYAAVNGRDPVATYPTVLAPGTNNWSGCLDYIFVSSNIQVHAAELCFHNPHPQDDTLYPSDHVGLLARLELRPTS